MKKVLYSNYTKFIAFILCALFVAFASYLLTTNFFNEDNIYLFENSYEDSYHAARAVSSEFYELSRMLENTTDGDGHLHPEKIKSLPSDSVWEYYIRVNDNEYTNVKNQSYSDFENSNLSYGVSADFSLKWTKSSGPTREGFVKANTHYRGYYFIDSQKDSYQLCVRMPQKKVEENRIVWANMKAQCDSAAKKILILLSMSLVLFIYLLCVTGKKYQSDEIQMMLIDKMFVEITAALFLGIFFGFGTLTILGAAYFIIEEGIMIANGLAAIAVFGVVSLSMLLALSLVRNLKNGTFLKRSMIVRIWKFVWKYFKKICKFAWGVFIKICKRIRNGLSQAKHIVLMVSAKNFSGRFVGILIAAFAFGVFILTVMTMAAPLFIVFLMAFVIAVIVFAAKRLIGFENLKDGIEKIKDGDLNHKITDCPDGVFRVMAQNINTIGDGLQKSLEREVKAERMKSELITNVSHDLKTPLTSIISYADLLSKETLAPYEANDYVKIIQQKSERLKQLTSDLFDISKVQSGNEEFNIEDIDICLLVNQTLAELGESIEKSGLDFRVTAQEKEMMIKGDGKKLSRVFENLFINCVKYAMKNTRVYIDIAEDGSRVSVEIKNIAGYEMTFDETEIAERFVRGDESRTDGGSGLGLAIVKSYTEGCGGTMEIKKDGDLFKVMLHFAK